MGTAISTLDQRRPTSEPLGTDSFAHLATRLDERLDHLVATALRRLDEKLSPSSAVLELSPEQIRALASQGLAAQIASFRDGILPESWPEFDDVALATLARPAGLELLLALCRAAQVTLWESWFELVEDSDLGDLRRRQLLEHGSDFFFRYADLLGDHLATIHGDRAAHLTDTPERRRFRALSALLEGDASFEGDRIALADLDYDLDRHHIGLLAWGGEPKLAVRSLSAELGRPPLCLSPPEQDAICWAWLSAARPLQPSERSRLADFVPVRGSLALGLEGFGESGFRSTHRQARRARRFARPEGPVVLHYADCVVEALTTDNEEDARAFLSHELRGIEDDSACSTRIRETLQAYFAAECNAASTAAALGIHQQTVANRLRAAEQRLGRRSIGARRVELEMALRLRACLGTEQV